MKIKKIEKVINLENAVEESFEILKMVKPDWDRDCITSKVFNSGITNKMCSFHLNGKEDDTILIRINGNGTEEFLDRRAEVESFHLLSKYNCAPQLYCVFGNGLCYQFIPGVTTTTETVCSPTVSRLIIQEMVKMHSIPKPEDCKPVKPSLFEHMKRFLHLIMEDGESKISWSFSELQSEVDEMEERLGKLNSPVVFCHNDLLIHNIVYDKSKDKISFIDYEYASFNYQAYDIANHFCEYAGLDLDYSLYPTEEYQLNWLKSYLLEHEKRKMNTNIEEDKINEAVKTLYQQVKKFTLAAHLLWGLWALVQAKSSDIDFDYNEYSNLRLREYFKQKSEVL